MIELDIYSNTPDEISIVERYWAMNSDGKFKESVKDLLPFYHITSTTQLSAFIRSISQAWDMNQICKQCGKYQEVASRSEIKTSHQEMRQPCAACQRVIDEELREAEAKIGADLQRRLATASELASSRKIAYIDLPDDIALILIALERAINPRLFTSTFMRSDCRALVPCYVGDFIKKLYKSVAIIDNPSEAVAGTYFVKDNQLWHKSDQVVYSLTPNSTFVANEDAFNTLVLRPFDNHKAILNLWLDYATTDCMRYLLDQCEMHGLYTTTEDDEEIQSIFRTALRTYSVAHMWSAIWKIVKDAASLSTRTYYNREKAAATIPGKISRFLEKVQVGQVTLKRWSRPESQSSGTLGQVFKEIFGIDEETEGTTVMSIFADTELPYSVDSKLSIGELAEPTRQLMTCALARGMEAQVMLLFADMVRNGIDTASAINSVFKAFPVFKKPEN
ncbi:hypothetical protein ACO0LD_09590 [Undibacterium sp. Ji83W]|uniref:hypothetical protein n=1 Tax=Undibacterium sp. Ji83W TaxID=3413043 RepID=UPI003BF2DC39